MFWDVIGAFWTLAVLAWIVSGFLTHDYYKDYHDASDEAPPPGEMSEEDPR